MGNAQMLCTPELPCRSMFWRSAYQVSASLSLAHVRCAQNAWLETANSPNTMSSQLITVQESIFRIKHPSSYLTVSAVFFDK